NNDGVAKNDRFYSIENVTGTAFDDSIAGNALDNLIDGGLSDDVLKGVGGNDTLIGGSGADIMTGGDGNDRFRLEDGSNGTSHNYWEADVITDFTSGFDKLEIDDAVFGANVTLTVGAGISSGSGSAPNLHFETTNARLWYDADGAGLDSAPVLIATLENVTTLTMSDFILI
ncbi:MAG TPA: hypothetical protein VGX37_12725, partial [Allosphingosinicella sp.]|nr:hypothetical protein [Allosphingosinicella sp.]